MIKVDRKEFKKNLSMMMLGAVVDGVTRSGREITETVSKKAKENLESGGHNVTKTLFNSINVGPVLKGNPQRFMVMVDAPFAEYVEEGTGPAVGQPGYWIPKSLEILMWCHERGIPYQRLKQHIYKHGTKGIHFMSNAVEDTKSVSPEILARNIKMSLKAVKNAMR